MVGIAADSSQNLQDIEAKREFIRHLIYAAEISDQFHLYVNGISFRDFTGMVQKQLFSQTLQEEKKLRCHT